MFLKRFKPNSHLDYCRAKVLYDHCNGDIRLIQKEVKNRFGRNTKPTYQIKKIKEYLPLIQPPKCLKLENMIKLNQAKNLKYLLAM